MSGRCGRCSPGSSPGSAIRTSQQAGSRESKARPARHGLGPARADRPENGACLEIYEERAGEAGERLFAGWMFSSSPALSALEHPVYDVTLLECKGATPPSPAPTVTPAAASTDR